jgi:hypothetical protein
MCDFYPFKTILHERVLHRDYSNKCNLSKKDIQSLMDIQDQHGQTPLFLAVSNNDRHFVKYLLQLGANPNLSENNFKYTPLHLAIKSNYNTIAKLLLDCPNINLDIQDVFLNKPTSYLTLKQAKLLNLPTSKKVTNKFSLINNLNWDIRLQPYSNIYFKDSKQTQPSYDKLTEELLEGKFVLELPIGNNQFIERKLPHKHLSMNDLFINIFKFYNVVHPKKQFNVKYYKDLLSNFMFDHVTISRGKDGLTFIRLFLK